MNNYKDKIVEFEEKVSEIDDEESPFIDKDFLFSALCDERNRWYDFNFENTRVLRILVVS